MLAHILVYMGAIPPRGFAVAFACLVEFVVLCAVAMALIKTALSDAAYRRRRDVIKTAVALAALGLITLSLPSDAGADGAPPVVATNAGQ